MIEGRKEIGRIVPSPNQQTPELGELLRIAASRTRVQVLSAYQGVGHKGTLRKINGGI